MNTYVVQSRDAAAVVKITAHSINFVYSQTAPIVELLDEQKSKIAVFSLDAIVGIWDEAQEQSSAKK